MCINEKKNYIVEKTLMLNEYRANNGEYIHTLNLYRPTDIFNKNSETMVCFSGAYNCKVMYCEKCNSTHYDNMDIKVELRQRAHNKNSKYLEAIAVKCEKCGSEYDINDIKIVHHLDKRSTGNTKFLYKKVYNDDDCVKLSFKTSTLLVSRAFYNEDNRYKIIFNAKTGHTYLYNCPTNKKNKRKFIKINRVLSNVTYAANIMEYCLDDMLIDESKNTTPLVDDFKEIHDYLHEKISNNLGYTIPTLEEYANASVTDDYTEKEIYTLRNLMIYNRYPNINTFDLLSMIGDSGYGATELPSKFKRVKGDDDIASKLAEVYKISNEEILREYLENYSRDSKDIGEILIYLRLFKNKECILDLVNDKRINSYMFDNSDLDKIMQRKNNRASEELILLEDMVKELGESKACTIFKAYLTSPIGVSKLRLISKIYYDYKFIDKKYKINLKAIYDIMMDEYNLGTAFNKETVIHKLRGEFYKMADYLYNKHKKAFSFKIKTMDEYYDEYKISMTKSDVKYIKYHYRPDGGRYNMLAMKIYATNPTENPYNLLKLFNVDGSEEIEKLPSFFNKLNKKSTDVIGDLLSYYKVPVTKSVRKTLRNNNRSIISLIYFASLFKDVNILNRLINEHCEAEVGGIHDIGCLLNDVSNNILAEEEFSFSSYNVPRYRVARAMLKKMIDEKGEVVVSKKLLGARNVNIRNIVTDIGRMYTNYIKLYNTEEMDMSGTMLEIHDRLVSLTGSADTPLSKADLKPFKYTEEELSLTFEKEGYSFDLAKNGKELVEVGYRLKNCVGSYTATARRKECLIVPVMYNGEYKICIELRKEKDNYTLNQAKLYANTEVSKDLEALEVVKCWIEKNNIIDKSYDLSISSNTGQGINYNIPYNEAEYEIDWGNAINGTNEDTDDTSPIEDIFTYYEDLDAVPF